MSHIPATPTKEQITAMQAWPGLAMENITLVASVTQAEAAFLELENEGKIGFDTESKPTFRKGETSNGPHILQFSTTRHAYIFQSHISECLDVVSRLLLSPSIQKIGFGLRGDLSQIWQRFGIRPDALFDLDQTFRMLGYHNAVGAKSAIAMLFERRLQKSKRITTSNWASRNLTTDQILYAANDAYAAIAVHHALQKAEWFKSNG
jgi:ribonuclease D